MGRTGPIARQIGCYLKKLSWYSRRLSWYSRRLSWYSAALMGDNHYQRYVEHRHRTHPGAPVLTEREYWRLRHSVADSAPAPRCC